MECVGSLSLVLQNKISENVTLVRGFIVNIKISVSCSFCMTVPPRKEEQLFAVVNEFNRNIFFSGDKLPNCRLTHAH